MNSSATIIKISTALVKAQKAMGNAKKDAENPFFKKKYADLNAIREACLPILNENGVSVLQPTCMIDGASFVETILLHESGEYISSITPILSVSANDPQKHGSGLSYARRYALQSIINIGADDDDGQEAVKPVTVKAAPPQEVKKEAPDKKDLAHAIKMIEKSETLETLKANRDALPKIIVTDASFITAAKKRYSVIMAEKPAPNV